VRTILPLIVSVFVLAGCASLATVDPATGTSPAQDIMEEVTASSQLLPPPLNMWVPAGAGLVLTLLIALGKAKPAAGGPTPTSPTGR
jgi:hypothetical protein